MVDEQHSLYQLKFRETCSELTNEDGLLSLPQLVSKINDEILFTETRIREEDFRSLIRIFGVPVHQDRALAEELLEHLNQIFISLKEEHLQAGEQITIFEFTARLRKLFDQLDVNSNNKIYADQIKSLISSTSSVFSKFPVQMANIPSIDMVMNRLDKEGRGYIDFDNFLGGILSSFGIPVVSSVLDVNARPDQVSTESAPASIGPTEVSPLTDKEVIWREYEISHVSESDDNIRIRLSDEKLLESKKVMAELRNQIDQLDQTCRRLKDELFTSESLRAITLEKLEEKERLIKEYKKQLKKTRVNEQSHTQFVEEFERLRIASSELEKKYQELEKDKELLEEEKIALLNEVHEKRMRNNILEDRQGALESIKKTSAKYEMEISQLTSELSELKEKINIISQEQQGADETIASSRKSNALLKRQLDEYDYQLREARDKIAYYENIVLLSTSKSKKNSLAAMLNLPVQSSFCDDRSPNIHDRNSADIPRLNSPEPPFQRTLDQVSNKFDLSASMSPALRSSKEKKGEVQSQSYLSKSGVVEAECDKEGFSSSDVQNTVTALKAEIEVKAEEICKLRNEIEGLNNRLIASEEAIRRANSMAAKATAMIFHAPLEIQSKFSQLSGTSSVTNAKISIPEQDVLNHVDIKFGDLNKVLSQLKEQRSILQKDISEGSVEEKKDLVDGKNNTECGCFSRVCPLM
ncbi:myosin-9-like [Schistocerca gregaria]|uniref:myosin-9-like n=1 Tax=Schistocerca gregaria TaxID=7010 RepID=UPI00211DDE99|nr:myosin-9-like [Schistocerca gregaria]